MVRTNPICLLMTMTFGLLSACETPVGSNEREDGAGPETGEEISSPDEDEDKGEGESGIFVPDIEEPICDPWAQDCGAGQKCVPYSSDGGTWDANKCVPITGDGQPGDTCSYDGLALATDSCGADSHCWDVMEVDGQLEGVCTTFCQGSRDNPLCGPETECLNVNGGAINLCVKTCDPLQQDCAAGLGCFWANNNFQCIFTAGEILNGEPCGYINDCAPGSLCATAEVLPVCNGSACCTPFCDLGEPHCADQATECSAFFEEGAAPPNYESVGVCILPGT